MAGIFRFVPGSSSLVCNIPAVGVAVAADRFSLAYSIVEALAYAMCRHFRGRQAWLLRSGLSTATSAKRDASHHQ